MCFMQIQTGPVQNFVFWERVTDKFNQIKPFTNRGIFHCSAVSSKYKCIQMQPCKFISSPEHEGLRVSCCDRAVSIVSYRMQHQPFQLLHTLEATFSVRYSVRMFALMKSRMSLKMGHVGSKARSLGQILENLLYAQEATFSV